MRRIFGIWVLLLPMVLMAAPVSQEQAMQKARVFVNSRPQMAQGGKLKAARAPLKLQSAQTTASYYVFNVGEGQGFVIASGDDRTPAILGYADDGRFDADNIPSNMKAWLEEYERQISLLDKYPAANSAAPSYEAIDPLITSKWDQDSPYNNLCPIDPQTGKQSLAGCVATAMAQIMNYHKYPDATTTNIPAYTTKTYGIYVDGIPANTVIDWNNVLDCYDKNATEVQKQAIAKLMQICGCSVNMDYSSEASGARYLDAAKAFVKYFGYDKNLLFKYRYRYRAAEWEDVIYHELEEMRPVYMSGNKLDGWGHGFVVDGYDCDRLFHINWGWSGIYDGYFLLDILDFYHDGTEATITENTINIYQYLITGIQKPVETGTADANPALATSYMAVNASEKEFQRQTDGTFSIPISFEMSNEMVLPHSFDIGCGIYNEQDELVGSTLLFEAVYMNALGDLNKNCNVTLPADLPDGNYILKCLSKNKGADKWQLGYGNFRMRILCSIKDNVLTTHDVNDAINLSGTIVSTTEQPTVGSEVRLKAQITNNGTNFNQLIHYKVNDVHSGAQFVDIKSGETTSVNLAFVPTRSGANDVRLIIPERDLVVAQGTINVLGREDLDLMFDLGIKGMRKNMNVAHTDIDVTINIHNNSRYAYNDNILVELYKHDNNHKVIQSKELSVAIDGDSDSQEEISFEGLESNGNYDMIAFYIRDGKYYYRSSEVLNFTNNISADGTEDLTSMITNSDFEQGKTGWTIDAASGGSIAAGGNVYNQCFEAYNNSRFDIYQTLTDIPVGVYKLQVQGFYRYNRYDDGWNAWKNGTIDIPVYAYMNNSTIPLKNMFEESAQSGFYSGDYYTSPTDLYFPNDMSSAATAFRAGMYQLATYGFVWDEQDIVQIGMKGATDQNEYCWAIWDNFKLTYLGIDVQYVRPVLQQIIDSAEKLIPQMMSHSAYEQLASALAEAKATEQSTDGKQMLQVIKPLNTAIDAAAASTKYFLFLTDALDKLQSAIDQYHVASAAVQQEAADLLAEITAKATNHQYEDIYVDPLIAQINAEIHKLRIPENMELATVTNPVECTSLLNNPGFEQDGQNSIDAWDVKGNYSFGKNDSQMSALAIEVSQDTLLIRQPIYDIPNGYYAMQVSAFYRYGTASQDAEYLQQGIEPTHVVLIMGDPITGKEEVAKPMKLISTDYSDVHLSNGKEYHSDYGYYVPNDIVAAVAYFKAGHYKNTLLFEAKNNSLYTGVRKSEIVKKDWMVMDDFRLFYYGTEKPDDQQVGIAPVQPASFANSSLYDLQGRRVSANHRGLVISRELKPDGTVVTRKILK